MDYVHVTIRFELHRDDLEAVVETAQRTGRGLVRLTAEDQNRILEAASRLTQLAADTAREIGKTLFQGIFVDTALRVFHTEWDQARKRGSRVCLRFQVRLEHPALARLARLPWELLHEPEGEDFLLHDRRFLLVRGIELEPPVPPLALSSPLHILLASASPFGSAYLDVTAETCGIDTASNRRFSLESLTNVGLSHLADRLSRGAGGPAVFHFIGHGRMDTADREAGILLEDGASQPVFVGASTLSTALRGTGIRLVILNACQTGSLPEDPFAGVATALLRSVPAVVAMQQPIEDRAAVRFSEALYGSLAATGRIDQALTEARIALALENPGQGAWAIPVLYLRGLGQLFEIPEGSAQASDIEPVFERLRERFSDSIRHHLAGGQLIPRKETRDLLDCLAGEDSCVIVVHGVAGSGKSGVLYELAEELTARGAPFLPLRLDRNRLQGDPQLFGRKALGLPDSPARCLAAVSGDRRGVLLLDQLDAFRWTSAHSSEAWEVCREIITEALATPHLDVVVCCRTFDLEHDPLLRGWEKETRNLKRVKIDLLSPDDVAAALERAAEGRETMPILRDKEKELLRHVLHLQMWLAIYQSATSAPEFNTAWNLMAKFWASRRDELVKDNVIDRARAEILERRLVDALQAGAVLSARVRLLDMSERELKLYQDHHLLQVDGQSFSFCHQTYQDYLIACHLLGELDRCAPADGGRKVLEWLGGRERQSIFRREQVRLLLGALRAEEHNSYLPTLLEFLPRHTPEPACPIRFHLRLLVAQFLGQLYDPRLEEVELVLDLLDDPFWCEHVLGEVVHGQKAWFEALDDRGWPARWLAGEDLRRRDQVLDVLPYLIEECGDRVARLLEPYLDGDESWARRIVGILRFEPSTDSDAVFELRLRMTQKGIFFAEYVNWAKLARMRPDRFIVLVTDLLTALAADLSQGRERRRQGRRSQLDWHTLERVNLASMPREHWTPAWKAIFRAVSSLVQLQRYANESPFVLKTLIVEPETLDPVLHFLKGLARNLLETDWQATVRLGEDLSKVHRRAEALFLDSLVEGPVSSDFADWAIDWLVADPWRVRLRVDRESGPWALSSQLVERFSPACSWATYERLEKWLLAYREPDLLETYKRRHDRIVASGDLSEPSSFGSTAHALLPRLPNERRTHSVRACIEQLSRKFSHRSSISSRGGAAVRAGWVRSPLSAEAKTMLSDQAWLGIASKDHSGSGTIRVAEQGGFLEASPESFAADLTSMTRRQPERFARLLVRGITNIRSIFVLAILRGLGGPENGGEIEAWVPPRHETLEEVLRLQPIQDLAFSQEAVGMSLCELFEKYSSFSWSESALEILVWIAKHHEDPREGYQPAGSEQEDSDDFDLLENAAINVTRGAAGFAIQHLLIKQPALFSSLVPALESLARDPNPAVRVAAIAGWIPAIDIARDRAVEWFLQACEGPDAILATPQARTFMIFVRETHLQQLVPLIERMLSAPTDRVATAGASQVAAIYLISGQLDTRFQDCLGGTPAQRKGVAEVAAQLMEEGEFADRAKEALLCLAEDSDSHVAHAVAHGLGHLSLQHILADREAWSRFARSKAFQGDPSPLLYALDRQSGDLLPFADCLLAVGMTFAEDLSEASQNLATGISGDARQLLPLLLRLYEQAQTRDPDLFLDCLDLWDRLLERRVGAAMGLTWELDRL